MRAPGKNIFRPWMFIYVGLVAAIALAGRPVDVGTNTVTTIPAPKIVVKAVLFREDF